PVSGKQKEQVIAGAMTLARFKNGLPARNIVASMPVDDDEATKAVSDEVFQETVQQIDVSSGRGGQRARETRGDDRSCPAIAGARTGRGPQAVRRSAG